MIFPSRFQDRVAVVTGGASGIGEGIARRIAAEGGEVFLFDVDPHNLDRVASACGARPMLVDVSNESSVRDALAEVIQSCGKLDILVNSAGVVGPTGVNITEYASEDFQRVLQINLFGSYYVTRYALEPMLKRNYGRILLLASIAGKEGNPGMVGYSVSKAGVIGLVKAIGKEVAHTGVTVNGLAPAVIRTPLNERTSPEQLKYMAERIPMKRLGTVEETAALACWIVSDEASFNTGFVFDLSGGRATY